MIGWVRRLLCRTGPSDARAPEVDDAIATARQVRDDIDAGITKRHHEVAELRLEQTRIRHELVLDASLRRRNEDISGALERRSR